MTAKNQYEVTAEFEEGERQRVGLAERGDGEGVHVIHLFDEYNSANLINVEVSDEPLADAKKVVPAAPVADKGTKK